MEERITARRGREEEETTKKKKKKGVSWSKEEPRESEGTEENASRAKTHLPLELLLLSNRSNLLVEVGDLGS